MTTTTDFAPLRTAALRIYAEALKACSVQRAFASAVTLGARHRLLFQKGGSRHSIDLSGISRLLVVAVGKAAPAMAEALLHQLAGSGLPRVEGIIVAPEHPASSPDGFSFFCGGHPLPTSESFRAAEAARMLLRGAAAEAKSQPTFCFFLLNGGASAMLELPLDPAISLEDTVLFHHALVHCGASIAEINCVRKHFSAIKGGRLAQALGAIPSVTLAVSDVPENSLHALGSGPTVPDPSTVEQCRGILERYDLLQQLPASVAAFFQAPGLPETPKALAAPTQLHALLSARDLANAAVEKAAALGFHSVVDNTCDEWEADRAASYLLGRLRELRQMHQRVCLISVGEVAVRVPATVSAPGQAPQAPGVGGRNQHFALLCASHLHPGEPVAVLSAGSDGIDGNSPAAGAVVDAGTAAGFAGEAKRALLHFDSYSFLHQRGCTILTGPTGNNIRDLRLLLADDS